MNEQIKLLFVANFSQKLIAALSGVLVFCRTDPVISHVFEFSPEGEADDRWIPRIAPGGWTVVSSDRAKRCGGPKLPRICYQCNVNHILLSATIHVSPQIEKARAVISTWPKILDMIPNNPKGSRYSLRYGLDRNPVLLHVPAKF